MNSSCKDMDFKKKTYWNFKLLDFACHRIINTPFDFRDTSTALVIQRLKFERGEREEERMGIGQNARYLLASRKKRGSICTSLSKCKRQ